MRLALVALAVACMPTQDLVDAVTGPKYREVPLFEGVALSPTGMPVPARVYANAASGTWTLAIEPAPGISCILVPGQGFRPSGRLPTGKPS